MVFVDMEELKTLGIYELRSVARNVGVQSPTSKRRDELIDLIKKFNSGELKVNKKSHAGRPVKMLQNQEEIMQSIFKDDGIDEVDKLISKQSVTFSRNIDNMETPMSMINHTFKGILGFSTNKKYYCINMNKISRKEYILIDEELVKELGLVEGDFIEGVCNKIATEKHCNCENITLVNNETLQNLKTFELDKDFIVDNTPVYENINRGNLSFKNIEDFNEVMKQIKSVIETNKGNDNKYVIAGVDLDMESLLEINSISSAICCSSLFDGDEMFAYERLEDTINFAQTSFNRGENVVVFILDTFACHDMLERYRKKYAEFNINADDAFRKLINCSKASNEGSITTFAYYSQSENNRNMIERIKKLSK